MKLRSYSRLLILLSLITLITGSVFSQSMGGPPPIGGYRSPSADPDVVHRNSGRQRIGTTESRRDPTNNTTVFGNGRPLFKSEGQLNAKERMLLATHPEDQRKYVNFLRQPGTGLFRLLPYESRGVVSVETLKTSDGVLPIKGHGAYYSFSKLRHELDGWSEIGLQNGKFELGFAHRALGFIGLLGEVPLESVTLDSRGVDYLHKLDPPTVYQDILAQGDESIRRLHVGGFGYSSTIAALVDNTYVLRSTISGKADVLVALRVIRQGDDGSLHILWKTLASYPKPNLKSKTKK